MPFIASGRCDDESYVLWTDQLLAAAYRIQKARTTVLNRLEHEVQTLMPAALGTTAELTMRYEYARPYVESTHYSSTEELLVRYPALKNNELLQKRTLFGAHLDDFSLFFQGKLGRTYASRGQQKLLIFLLKLAHIKSLSEAYYENKQSHVILLVDDFLADFDEQRAQALLPLMHNLQHNLLLLPPSRLLSKKNYGRILHNASR